MSIHSILTNTANIIKNNLGELVEFQSRIWVINIHEGTLNDESFIINEDSFQEPMQWMVKRQYTDEMIDRVDNMKRSEIIVFQLAHIEHRLIRVK